jgi:hypothetical protein
MKFAMSLFPARIAIGLLYAVGFILLIIPTAVTFVRLLVGIVTWLLAQVR